MSLCEVPNEVLEQIIFFMPIADLSSLVCASQELQNITLNVFFSRHSEEEIYIYLMCIRELVGVIVHSQFFSPQGHRLPAVLDEAAHKYLLSLDCLFAPNIELQARVTQLLPRLRGILRILGRHTLSKLMELRNVTTSPLFFRTIVRQLSLLKESRNSGRKKKRRRRLNETAQNGIDRTEFRISSQLNSMLHSTIFSLLVNAYQTAEHILVCFPLQYENQQDSEANGHVYDAVLEAFGRGAAQPHTLTIELRPHRRASTPRGLQGDITNKLNTTTLQLVNLLSSVPSSLCQITVKVEQLPRDELALCLRAIKLSAGVKTECLNVVVNAKRYKRPGNNESSNASSEQSCPGLLMSTLPQYPSYFKMLMLEETNHQMSAQAFLDTNSSLFLPESPPQSIVLRQAYLSRAFVDHLSNNASLRHLVIANLITQHERKVSRSSAKKKNSRPHTPQYEIRCQHLLRRSALSQAFAIQAGIGSQLSHVCIPSNIFTHSGEAETSQAFFDSQDMFRGLAKLPALQHLTIFARRLLHLNCARGLSVFLQDLADNGRRLSKLQLALCSSTSDLMWPLEYETPLMSKTLHGLIHFITEFASKLSRLNAVECLALSLPSSLLHYVCATMSAHPDTLCLSSLDLRVQGSNSEHSISEAVVPFMASDPNIYKITLGGENMKVPFDLFSDLIISFAQSKNIHSLVIRKGSSLNIDLMTMASVIRHLEHQTDKFLTLYYENDDTPLGMKEGESLVHQVLKIYPEYNDSHGPYNAQFKEPLWWRRLFSTMQRSSLEMVSEDALDAFPEQDKSFSGAPFGEEIETIQNCFENLRASRERSIEKEEMPLPPHIVNALSAGRFREVRDTIFDVAMAGHHAEMEQRVNEQRQAGMEILKEFMDEVSSGNGTSAKRRLRHAMDSNMRALKLDDIVSSSSESSDSGHEDLSSGSTLSGSDNDELDSDEDATLSE